MAVHRGIDPPTQLRQSCVIASSPMDLGGRGGNRTPETEVRGLQPRDTNQQCPLAHVPLVASEGTCLMVWIVSSTTTHPVSLGVGALHPRLSRVSITFDREPL